MTLSVDAFGDFEGRRVDRAVLTSNAGVTVQILNYGAIIQDWRVPIKGEPTTVVVGFNDMDGYVHHSRFFGAVAGRVANRTSRARFDLNGKTYAVTQNHGKHSLHGGDIGLAKRVWDMETDAGSLSVRLTCRSPDGEDGWPGNVDFTVTYQLIGHILDMGFAGVPDEPSPLNLVQHSYFNLNGGGDVRDHQLTVQADRYTPVDDELIPTGDILAVDGTKYDFRAGRGLDQSYDINLVLAADLNRTAPVAVARAPKTGLGLRLHTDQPAVQLFNAAEFDIDYPGLDGQSIGNYCGFCLECQHYPDSLNNPNFPSIISTPDAPYGQSMIVAIGEGL